MPDDVQFASVSGRWRIVDEGTRWRLEHRTRRGWADVGRYVTRDDIAERVGRTGDAERVAALCASLPDVHPEHARRRSIVEAPPAPPARPRPVRFTVKPRPAPPDERQLPTWDDCRPYPVAGDGWALVGAR